MVEVMTADTQKINLSCNSYWSRFGDMNLRRRHIYMMFSVISDIQLLRGFLCFVSIAINILATLKSITVNAPQRGENGT